MLIAGAIALIRDVYNRGARKTPNKRLILYIAIITIGYGLMLIGFILEESK